MQFLERVAPGVGGTPPWCRRQHLARYDWVAQWVRGRQVVDAACGLGYGTIQLRQAGAAHVTGFDIDPETIALCRATAQDVDGVEFQTGDVTALPLNDKSIDVFVSFETLEHIQEPDAFLTEIRRVVRPGGLFVCSTPNRELFNPGTRIIDRPMNPFHFREYDQEEFRNYLTKFFSSAQWYGQSGYATGYVRRLAAVGRRFPRSAMPSDSRRNGSTFGRAPPASTPQGRACGANVPGSFRA